MAPIKVDQQTAQDHPPSVLAEETYHGHFNPTAPVKLRIATGGAGQSGLLRALADAFINDLAARENAEPFSVAWFKSDTTVSFNYLAANAADLSITYHPAAENIAVKQGIADRREYAWRDHWLLVGPKSNPAKLFSLKEQPDQTIYDLFTQLFCAAMATSGCPTPVRFLSRYDKSACNIKESAIWTALGQIPWAEPMSNWYHACPSFPFAALATASELGEYTLTDRGTWLASPNEVTQGMAVFMEGGDDGNEVLLNPAHLLVGRDGKHQDMAMKFVDWMARRGGGQEVVSGFAVNGHVLYSMVPGMS